MSDLKAVQHEIDRIEREGLKFRPSRGSTNALIRIFGGKINVEADDNFNYVVVYILLLVARKLLNGGGNR